MPDPHGRANTRPPLAEDTVGPYYPYVFVDSDRSDLTRLHPGLSVQPTGQPIVLVIRLIDSAGEPVADALLEFWQANAAGLYWTPQTVSDPQIDPYFDGFARVLTTVAPTQLRTIKPGTTGARGSAARRAPHITITLFSDGIARLVTQIFFDDESEANAADPLLLTLPQALRPRLVAKTTGSANGVLSYEITIVLRGEDETPFFDDLAS